MDNSKQDDPSPPPLPDDVEFVDYEDESQIDHVMTLVGQDLSEPYSKLCILAVPKSGGPPIGCVVGKIDEDTGYIGMLAIRSSHRRRGIGRALVHEVLRRMKDAGCASATLETEVSNASALRLYQESFGFLREELLVRYYLNWNHAYRLRLWF